MTTLDKAIREFGFEDARTITIAFLEERGQKELAETLWEILTNTEDEEDPLDEDEEYLNEDEEMGFDPYEGCYTYDC